MHGDTKRILVVDVESTCWEHYADRPAGLQSEIIEIGFSELDTDTLKVSPGESIYVIPEGGELSPFCERLTGISWNTLLMNNAVRYKVAVEKLRERFPELRHTAWASWGDYDREMFVSMAILHGGSPTGVVIEHRKAEPTFGYAPDVYPFGRAHINIRVLDALVREQPKQSGMEALEAYGLKFEGRPHCGRDDAFNTAHMLAEILRTSRKGFAHAHTPMFPSFV